MRFSDDEVRSLFLVVGEGGSKAYLRDFVDLVSDSTTRWTRKSNAHCKTTFGGGCSVAGSERLRSKPRR